MEGGRSIWDVQAIGAPALLSPLPCVSITDVNVLVTVRENPG